MILSREILIGILAVILLATAVGGLNYWGKYKEEKLNEVATLVYLYEKGELKAQEVEPQVKSTPFYPYLLAASGKSASQVAKHLEDKDLKSLFLEKEAYELYEEKKYEEALSKLKAIKEESFNYPSSLMLKAFIYEVQGKEEEAKKTYSILRDKYAGSYFSRIAYARLLSLENK